MKLGFHGIFSQLLAALTAFLTILLSGLWLSWVSVVLPKLRSGEIPIQVEESDVAWMVALMDVGNLISPIPSGYLMDRLGRLNAVRLSALAYAAASTLALTASTPEHLYFARLFAGVGKGIGYTVAPMYVGEIAGAKIRGALSGIFVIMLQTGSACSMTFGPWMSFASLNWITLLFPVAILLLSALVPESPYYHLMQGREPAARAALARLRGPRASDDAELQAIKKKIEMDMASPATWGTLFRDAGNWKALKILLVVNAFQRLGGISCVFAYASTTLPAPSGDGGGGWEWWDPRVTLIVFGWAGAVAGVAATSVIDSFGRKPLLIASTLALSLLTGQSAIYYYFAYQTPYDVHDYVFMPHLGIMLFGIAYAFGLGQVPHTLQSELLPTNVKGHASALATIVLSICSFATNKLYLTVSHRIGVYAMYLFFSLSSLCCSLFTLFCVFETKGKTLAEIQAILGH
ncbi:facilitated trehalose transporter Tret1 [Bemisia tabaci]|uniref:facilitated trehalose transporter Tret1 n=1 Tax=Bemisia tabaci TaxID=7038 RepID=UPI003B288F75